MSHPSYLERLFDGAQAEWKVLGDIGSFTYGYAAKANDIGDARFIRITDINTDGTLIPDDPKYVDLSKESEKYLLKKNDLLMARTGATFGKTMIFEEVYPAIYAGFLIRLNFDKKIINPKFYWHFAQSELFWNQANKLVSGGGQPQFNANALRQIQILIPCPEDSQKSLAIQAEIVRILDAFTTLVAELTKELTKEVNARRKQYNYYRAQLLSFIDDGVEWKTLGEVAEFRRGTAITGRQTTDGDIPVIANGPAPTYYHGKSNRIGETVVVARSGAYAGYISYWNQPIFLTDAFSVHPDIEVLMPRFVYHFLQNKQEHIHAMKKGAGVPHVRVKEFELYNVPIPSLDEQARIVAILDKFDTLTTSVIEGLTREIKLRQKQYEYYRDLLLSFPKPEGMAA